MSGGGGTSAALRALLSQVDAGAREADAVAPHVSDEIRLLAALLAAHEGDAALVADVLRRVQDSTAVRDYPTVAELHQVVLAEQERMTGNAPAAAARLRPLAAHAKGLVVTHWSLMRAERDAGNARAALVQADWLATHRGRAFAEGTTTDVLRFVNAPLTTVALLDQAELARGLGDAGRAGRQLQAFAAAWPETKQPGELRRRAARVQE